MYGIITALVLIIIIKVFQKNDDELLLAQRNIIPYLVCAILTGYFISHIDLTYNYIFIVPTICILFAAYTDMCIEQIYVFVCVVSVIAGVLFIIIKDFESNFAFVKYALIIILYTIILLAFQVINLGDVFLLNSLTPYFYLMLIDNIYTCTFLYLICSFIIALIVNLKNYIKYKKKSFPYAFPAAITYIILIYLRSIE